VAYEFDGLNINWQGGGGFARDDWAFVRTVIQALDVKTVLEYGCGLSTELMVAMGLDVLSLETQEQFADIYGAAGFNVKLCDYDEGYLDLRPLAVPPRELPRFDIGFVDGPGEQERHDRYKSVEHAALWCSAIYLHDYDLSQFEQLDDSSRWLPVTRYAERQNHLYIRDWYRLGDNSSIKRLAEALSARRVPFSDEFAELAAGGAEDE